MRAGGGGGIVNVVSKQQKLLRCFGTCAKKRPIMFFVLFVSKSRAYQEVMWLSAAAYSLLNKKVVSSSLTRWLATCVCTPRASSCGRLLVSQPASQPRQHSAAAVGGVKST